MIRINLIPPEISQRKKAKKRAVYLLGVFLGSIVIVLLVYLITSWYVFQANSSLIKIQESNQKVQNIVSGFKSYEDIQNEVTKRENIVNEISKNQILWSHVLNEFSMLAPVDVWLSYLEASSQEGMLVKGYTFQHPSTANLMIKLSEIKQGEKVNLQYSQKTILENQNVVEFNLSVKFPTAASNQPAPAQPLPEKEGAQ